MTLIFDKGGQKKLIIYHYCTGKIIVKTKGFLKVKLKMTTINNYVKGNFLIAE